MSAICLSENGRTSLTEKRHEAEKRSVFHKRNIECRATRRGRPARAGSAPRAISLLLYDIRDDGQSARLRRIRPDLCAVHGERSRFWHRYSAYAAGTPQRGCAEDIAVIGIKIAKFGLADPHAFFEDRVEHRARSPGERLMTCNTSAVAVCCSRASRVSLISRAFSIAMTACAAKFCKSAICLSVNGRTS